MYDCKLVKEETNEIVFFRLLENSAILVEHFVSNAVAETTATDDHEWADNRKQELLANGFKEI